jgi:hypothetical protein
MNTPHEGGCLCGTVRYRITGHPVAGTLCHCRSCRLASGAPSLAWTVVRVADFHHDGARPVEFESSPGIFRTFCGACGTSLTWRSAARPDTIDVTTASLDQPDDFAPTKEIWVEHKLSWETANPVLPHYARSSVGATPIHPGKVDPPRMPPP